MHNIKRNIILIILSLLLHLYFYGSEHIKKFDYEFYDTISILFHKIKEQEDSSYTVIIDIDEKSLQELGQWPWSRVIDAKLIDMVQKMNPSALGINILFPEQDRVSPVSIQAFYKKFFSLEIECNDFPDELKDNDKLLANSIKNADATLSTYFHNSPYTHSHCQNLSYNKNMFSTIKTEFSATALLCNHESIQKGIENFGFINAWTDSDGRFRRIPIFVEYNKKIFPSFALGTLLSFDKHIPINSDESTILVDFSKKNPKVFSAVDLLNSKIPSNQIQGKIVLIGSSVVGLNPIYTTSNGKKISNSMIHAFVIENILNNTFLTQPEVYKTINLWLSFLLSILIIILLSKRLYIYIIGLLPITAILSSFWLITSYMNGLYISIGYLWTPSLYFLLLILIYHANIRNKEKRMQEKILIRQSKLASMGEMISLIAHQWRQPLSSINGIVLNIDIDHRKEILHTQRLDEHLNKIEETTAYLSKTINDFTDFFSKTKNTEQFYSTDIILQAQQLSPISHDENIYIHYNEKNPIKIIGYKSELLQSLIIVLNNAIYACKKNLPHTGQGKIVIKTQRVKDNVFITIEDNGGGVENKNLKQIFNPYFTTKKKPHGTGLGLYILKLIVEESLNGKVSLINGREGAIFTIEIPINASLRGKS